MASHNSEPEQWNTTNCDDITDKWFSNAVDHSYQVLHRVGTLRLLNERRTRRAFERNLYQRHKQALNLFDHFLVICQDLGDKTHSTHGHIAEIENDKCFFALARLHARAGLTASEIRSLVFAGHASGALARWRTLHEITVIATFIEKHGQDAAERFMQSDRIKTAKEAIKFNTHCYRLGLQPLETQLTAEFEADRERLIKEFGPSFKEDWGWASDFLENKPRKPNFAQLEESVGMQHWQMHVSMAHHAVHGGYKGMIADIGIGIDIPDIMLSGPSMYGLVIPVDATLNDLYKCTELFLLHRPNEESHVFAATLALRMKRVRATFIQLERKFSEQT